MTFPEKRRLSVQLSRLTSGNAFQLVLDIVSEDPAVSSIMAEGTVDVDLDQLSTITLWKLQELVDQPVSIPAPPIHHSNMTEKKPQPADQNGVSELTQQIRHGFVTDLSPL